MKYHDSAQLAALTRKPELNHARQTMKKINTIDYGGKMIGVGLAFLCGIPAILYEVKLSLDLPEIGVLIAISLAIGAIIEAGVGCVLIMELRQDRIIDRFYAENPSSTLTPQQILDTYQWRRKR